MVLSVIFYCLKPNFLMKDHGRIGFGVPVFVWLLLRSRWAMHCRKLAHGFHIRLLEVDAEGCHV